MKRLTDTDFMPFGKYKGRPMRCVPASYLDWFRGECDRESATGYSLAVLNYIDENESVINKELEGNGGRD